MSERYGVFFGDVAQDEYFDAPYFPVAGDKVIVHELPAQFGGMVANAAATYAHFGAAASFISQLNSGALTHKLLGQLRELGLNTDFVIFDESVPDSRCIVILSGDQHIVVIPTLGITHTELTDATWEHLCGAQFLFTTLTDARPFRRGSQGAAEVLAELRRRGVLIVMDLDVYNPENHPSGLVEHCDILFMNSLGFTRFLDGGNDPAALIAAGARAVIVTRDRGGCVVHSVAGIEEIPGHDVPVVDVTGAGDTFSSAFLYSYTTHGDLSAAAHFANAAAAMSVTKPGARGGMTTETDVAAFLQLRSATGAGRAAK